MKFLYSYIPQICVGLMLYHLIPCNIPSWNSLAFVIITFASCFLLLLKCYFPVLSPSHLFTNFNHQFLHLYLLMTPEFLICDLMWSYKSLLYKYFKLNKFKSKLILLNFSPSISFSWLMVLLFWLNTIKHLSKTIFLA